MRISQLCSYPLKGGHGRRHSSTIILSSGLLNDRCWLLVDRDGHFVTQRSHPLMSQISVTYIGNDVYFRFGDDSLILATEDLAGSKACSVVVWKDKVTAYDRGEDARAFFSRNLAGDLRLCQVGVGSERFVSPDYSDGLSPAFYFADGFPFLVIAQESLDLLNDKLLGKNAAPVPMDRFRPNIVI
jgi:uncharacterized protein YcbX